MAHAGAPSLSQAWVSRLPQVSLKAGIRPDHLHRSTEVYRGLFTHLHNHTEFSLLDGLSRVEPLVERAAELGMSHLAITDHGGLYGAIDFYQAARANGVAPIIGCEMYVAPGSRHDRNPNDKKPYHMTVLAKDQAGYGNLVKLVTTSHLEGFYYHPRVDRELLDRHNEGLVVLSGCPSGEVPSLIAQGRMDDAAATIAWYRERFPDYYLELMEHGGVDELPGINAGLMELHRDLGIPVAATNDSHYIMKEHAPLQDILICIHTNTNVNDPKRLKMDEDSYYLRSVEEMAALYPDTPDAISNTMRIAEMCDLEFDFNRMHLPEFPGPEGMDADEYLAKLCWEGLRRRIDRPGEEEEARLKYELQVIRQTRYANYFLVVWDIARFVLERDIAFAVRGSAAGSLVLYCLGVTDVNPLLYRIVFERFLNVERREMPDIDMDFQDDRREEVLNYVVEKYGRDHVAQIITFGTLGAKASIRDVGRALAMPYDEVDRVARLVPSRLNMKLETALAESDELREIYEADESIRKLVDSAKAVEGTTRHSSTHAAGVVISKEPLDTLVPLQRPPRGDEDSISTTQYSMDPVADLGLLKMDFLGLSNLSILAKARGLISKTKGLDVDLRRVQLDDADTLQMLSDGDTVGVFQLEGTGMTSHIKHLRPSSMVDVASMIALYRPGPMEHIDTFIKAKHGEIEVKYLHPVLEPILEETYGVIVFQDQVFLIAQAFAGYSLGEADVLRKAMGKKDPAIMAQEKGKFIEGATRSGYSLDLAEQVFALIEPFAGYGFPKAHAVSYGLISYWTAYLKANFPEEYMVSLLNAYSDNTDKLAASVVECRRLGIHVLPPDVLLSDTEFAVEKSNGSAEIRFGLANVKNVGESAIEPFVKSRAEAEETPRSIEEMCRAVDMSSLTKKTLESLTMAGALDRFGDRGAILDTLDRIHSLAQSESALKNSTQTSMFDMLGESMDAPLAHVDLPSVKTADAEKQQWETELLGVTFSGNKLDALVGRKAGEAIVSRSQIGEDKSGKKVQLVGQVSSVSERTTKNDQPYLIANLALLEGDIDVFVWQNVIKETDGVWETGKLVEVEGTVRVRDDRTNISCQTAAEYDPEKTPEEGLRGSVEVPATGTDNTNGASPNGHTSPPPAPAAQALSESAEPPAVQQEVDSVPPAAQPGKLIVRLRESGEQEHDQRMLEDVKSLLLNSPGSGDIGLEIAADGRLFSLDWPTVKVEITDDLLHELRETLGDGGHTRVVER